MVAPLGDGNTRQGAQRIIPTLPPRRSVIHVPDARSTMRGLLYHPDPSHLSLSRHRRRQIADAYEVVGRHREGEDPLHDRPAPMPQLAQQRHRLEPAEDLLDPLALHLTDRVARVARGARIDATA